MNWFSSARLATSTSRWRTRSSLSRRLRASGPTPSVTMKMSAPMMPAEAKSLPSPRAASVVSVCCTSTASVATAANISARRCRTTNDIAPIGSTRSEARPLVVPPLA